MNAGLDMLEPRRSTFPLAAIAAILAKIVLLAAAVWLGFALYGRTAPRVGDGFWAFAVAVTVPLLLLGGLWLAREALRRRADGRAIERIEQRAQPAPGAWVAVAGRARAVGEPFEAPLSRRPALACRYRVMEQPYRNERASTRRNSSAMKLRLEGFHLVPTVIETPSARVRLRAFPELRNLEKSHLESGTSSVEETAARGPVWPLRTGRLALLFSAAEDQVRVDWRYGHVEQPHRTSRLEWVLAPDDLVCVVGRWSPDGSLLPHWSRTTGIPIYAGSPADAVATLRSELRVYLSFAAILLVSAAAILGWLAR